MKFYKGMIPWNKGLEDFKPQLNNKICQKPDCKKIFTPKSGVQIFCSDECKKHGRKNAVHKYNTSLKRNKSQKKYSKSLKGKMNKRIYWSTKKYKITQRNNQLKRKYGITLKEYGELYNKQKGKCAICNKKCKVLHIDHDHITGKVRGLLCGEHNRGIGMFNDNKDLLLKAINYLKNE